MSNLMIMKLSRLLLQTAVAAVTALTFQPAAAQRSGTFGVGENTFLLNGKPFVVKAAELHYPRIPRPYWEHRIKMCKALGMNTVCLYVFWNIHEQTEGVFDFSGQNDVAQFCRLAQKHGLYVIVRPGPYVCAEWEMGGLPWWLLKKKDIRLRENDPYFLSCVERFEREVGRQLAPLTIDKGGPIIMVQVENEYGSYGESKEYVANIRDIVKKSGFDKVALFQCDWASNFTKNALDDLVWTMNFGTGADIDKQFERLGQLRPTAPKMCSEFWSGWFDKWGARHETRPAAAMVDGIDKMLQKGISFSLYMTHGGTSFGHWAGANSPGFSPDVTSYDYDAPINEWGLPTPKYHLLRQTMQKYADGKLPAVPKAVADIISVPQFSLDEFAPLAAGIDSTATSRHTMTMEEMNMGWGTMVYTTALPEIEGSSVLTIAGAHDYARVLVDKQPVGIIDRVKKQQQVELPPVRRGQTLTVIVEAMGRINFGRAIKDFKGIVGDVTISAAIDGDDVQWNLKDWTISRIPDSYQTACRALAGAKKIATSAGAGYYRGYFNLKKTGDTFLNTEAFGKGQVYVNGHPIGRYWYIGPQQTLYVPGCWLKKGRNEVVVLDVLGSQHNPVCHGQDTHQLDKLATAGESKSHTKGPKFSAEGKTPVLAAAFAPGNGWQRVALGAPATGRYIAIECLGAHDGKDAAAIAELYLADAKGNRMSREGWTAVYADSESFRGGNNTADKTFDLQESTYWETARGAKFPHTIVIDLGSVCTFSAIDYLPRAEQGAPSSVKGFRLYAY